MESDRVKERETETEIMRVKKRGVRLWQAERQGAMSRQRWVGTDRKGYKVSSQSQPDLRLLLKKTLRVSLCLWEMQRCGLDKIKNNFNTEHFSFYWNLPF